MHKAFELIIVFVLFFLAVASVFATDVITKLPPDGGGKLPEPPYIDIIGGEEIPKGHVDYDSIVRIATDGANCTATVVGPKAILTAAHCGKNGAVSKFKIQGKDYSAKLTRAPLYPGVDHDLNLGLVTEEIQGVKPESIYVDQIKVGDPVHMYGYGCIQAGGGGGNDGILRKGVSEVSSFSSKDFVAKKPNGAALCFGDSGGPTFVVVGQQRLIAGVASKGNIKDTSYLANLTLQESKDFLKKWAADNQADLCGVTKDCITPPGPKPEVIAISSDALGELKFTLKGDTLDPLYVKRHMHMLMEYLESSFEMGDYSEIMPLPADCIGGKK